MRFTNSASNFNSTVCFGAQIVLPVECQLTSQFTICTNILLDVSQVGKQLVSDINQALEKHGVNMHVLALVRMFNGLHHSSIHNYISLDSLIQKTIFSPKFYSCGSLN